MLHDRKLKNLPENLKRQLRNFCLLIPERFMFEKEGIRLVGCQNNYIKRHGQVGEEYLSD